MKSQLLSKIERGRGWGQPTLVIRVGNFRRHNLDVFKMRNNQIFIIIILKNEFTKNINTSQYL